MEKLDEKQLTKVSGGNNPGIGECIARYTAGGFIGGLGGSVIGPVGTALGAGAGALTATPTGCKNN